MANWEAFLPKFIKVMPQDYKRMLAATEQVAATGMTGEEAAMAAFEQNIQDKARVAGN